jgi:hypothetical protein
MLEAMGCAAHGLELGDFQRNRAKGKGSVRAFASARNRPLRQAAARPFMRSFLLADCFASFEVKSAHLFRAAVLIALVIVRLAFAEAGLGRPRRLSAGRLRICAIGEIQAAE